MMPSDVVIDGGVLRIPAATVQHGGEYVCTALNVVGSDRLTATITVRSGQLCLLTVHPGLPKHHRSPQIR